VGNIPALRLRGSVCRRLLRSAAVFMLAAAMPVAGCFGPLHNSSSAVALNEEVNVGKFAFTVNSVNIGEQKIGNETAQGVFIIVQIAVKNIGDDRRTVYCQDQKLKDLAGKTYDNAVTVGDRQTLISIKPGQQVRFTCAFDVPKDTLPGAVEVHESQYSKGATVRVLERR
jgi:hypothetical protein